MHGWWVAMIAACLMLNAHAETLLLRVMDRAGESQAFFQQLLLASLAQAGIEARVQQAPDMPNARAESLLAKGQLDLHWFIRTPARDRQFLRVPQPLTDGMIGKRILMVPPDSIASYARLRTLADWQRSGKVAAISFGWADVDIWQYNALAVMPQRLGVPELYRLVASGSRGLDYFPRGSIEVMAEKQLHAGLVPLPGVMLVYPQDFYFYVSPSRPQLQDLLQRVLQQAEQSGLRQRLFQQYFGAALAELGMDKRQAIPLRLPPFD